MSEAQRATIFVGVILVLSAFLLLRLGPSRLKSDEEIIFFPTAARLGAEGGTWRLPLHAWVFEREDDSLWRRSLLTGLAASLGLGESAAQSETFRQRARWFLVDNERGKPVAVTLTEGSRHFGISGADGHLRGEITLQRIAPGAGELPFWLDYAAVLPAGDERIFAGRAQFVPPEGLSVISDIDDTVKISEVRDKEALLRNSFLEPFRAVPGMAAAYGRLKRAGAVFHYVSSSPWQLYPPLAAFLEDAGLPRGSFHLRSFRLKDQSVMNVFKSSKETKPPLIEGLLAAYPNRRFILIGDSGELDPEIYGDIARSHPGQIAAVFIRRVSPEDADAARYRAAFAGLPEALWTLFDDARAIVPPLGQ